METLSASPPHPLPQLLICNRIYTLHIVREFNLVYLRIICLYIYTSPALDDPKLKFV
jgi:hypothetical protein